MAGKLPSPSRDPRRTRSRRPPCRPVLHRKEFPVGPSAFVAAHDDRRHACVPPLHGRCLAPGHLRDHRTVSGVDQDLGDHRLPAGPIGKHNSGETAAGIDENVSRIAAQQEVHPGRDESPPPGSVSTRIGVVTDRPANTFSVNSPRGSSRQRRRRGRLVLAKIGPGAARRHAYPRPPRRGGCHRAQRAAHHQHVGLADNGNLPLALRNAPRRRTGAPPATTTPKPTTKQENHRR